MEMKVAADIQSAAVAMPLANGEGVGCYGCDAICAETGDHCRFVSKCTVVATGGCGQIYPSTTNPVVATGDGIAMAARSLSFRNIPHLDHIVR